MDSHETWDCEAGEWRHPVILGKPLGSFLPNSFALWIVAAYVGLFIIRPWEVLLPQLAVIHFERLAAIFVIFSVGLSHGFRLTLNMQNVAVAAFVAAVTLSAALAWDTQAAWGPYYVFLTLVACYVLLVSVICSPYDLLFIVGAYIGFMELYMGKALWEYFVNARYVHTQGVTRLIGIESTFGNFNVRWLALLWSPCQYGCFCGAAVTTFWPNGRWVGGRGLSAGLPST